MHDGGGGGGGGSRAARTLEGLSVHRYTLHRARAVRRRATPVGREAATPATDGAFGTIQDEWAHIICTKSKRMLESRRNAVEEKLPCIGGGSRV
ncbi:hypothetical protein JOB18_030509 [Solea senegalensis]|uniref:Uncharacterized protein n=1 Tax=Solea senegalensis TaxID=28829 RepID=A0AAV6QGC9_SOLSE|nr:hypothetical protein JOB18_030509 [Solea senegalensis]